MISAPLDLGLCAVTEDATGLVAATRWGVPRAVVAFVLASVAVWLAVSFVRAVAAGAPFYLMPLRPLFAVFFGVISVILVFGRHSKSVDRVRRLAMVSGGVLFVSSSAEHPLPAKPVVRVAFRRELNATTGRPIQRVSRHYDIGIDSVPAMGFTVSSDRDAALGFAARLAAATGGTLVDEIGDDGVERPVGGMPDPDAGL